MAARDIITIGASAGGIETLKRLLAQLPTDFPAAILIVQHLHPRFPSDLAGILTRFGSLPATFATDGDRIEPGRVYIAAPDRHLLVEPKRLRVVHGPKENRSRPAIDPLFRSAAWSYGPRVIGVVLSGTLDDGAAGLWAIRSCGGMTVVQDPTEALFAEMPTSALVTLNVDHCLPIDGIADLLQREVGAHSPEPSLENRGQSELALESSMIKLEKDVDVEDMLKLGKPSGFSCPTCHGGLWELDDGELVRYRCHVGHAFGPDSLLASQSEEIETALESALRALEEKGAAARRLRDRLSERVPTLAQRYETQSRGMDEQAAVIRRLLRDGQAAPLD